MTDGWSDRLHAWEARYQTWSAPINQAIHDYLHRQRAEGEDDPGLSAVIDQAQAAQLEIDDPYGAFNEMMAELAPAYLAASDDGQRALREAVAELPGVRHGLFGYAYHCASRIKGPADGEWLEQGLVAMILEDCGSDFRDSYLVLAELYVRAERAGLKPRTVFSRLAKHASYGPPRGGMTAMVQTLEGFHSYAVLRERRRREDRD